MFLKIFFLFFKFVSNLAFCQCIWDFKIIWNVYFFIVQYWLNNTVFYFFHWSFYKFILVIVYFIINYFIISKFQIFKFWNLVLNQNINIFLPNFLCCQNSFEQSSLILKACIERLWQNSVIASSEISPKILCWVHMHQLI